jgi:predicted transcriptional regulator
MLAIQNIRKNVLAVTQSDLARICSVSQGTVSKWERGELAPDLSAMRAIREEAARRGIDWDDRLFFDDLAAPASLAEAS